MSTTIAAEQVAVAEPQRPGYFGEFGGQFVPEVLMPAIQELEVAYAEARDDPLLAHAEREQRLPEGVVDLVGAGVGQVLALEEDAAADLGGEAGGLVEGGLAADEVAELLAESGLELGIVAGLGVGDFELLDGGHQDFRYELAAVLAEVARPLGLSNSHLFSGDRGRHVEPPR